jgi:hypothetical protein
MELLAASIFYAAAPPRSRGRRMLQAFLVGRTLSVLSALLGGFGVFCVLYSFAAPEIAAKALILLGAALTLGYFNTRQ